MPFKKLLENMNKARPGGSVGPKGPTGLDVEAPEPNESQMFNPGQYLPDYT